ncbi:MAG: ATP-dependent sacrificial sulfur transferase LarE [SAR324 cluster bacterium]|nr:ATP-dependent sacrificial sulfur transferase LarE [SAR324 cluster bacterium]
MSTIATISELTPDLAEQYNALQQYFHKLESAVVAFSGGIDSSLVAYVAAQVLGDRVLAVTSASESLKREDLHLTQELAQQWNLSHQIIHTQEIDNPNYQANPINRCYYCKTTLYQALEKLAKERGYRHIMNGTNLDDLTDYRPGLVAAKEYGILAPLADCQFNKAQIRRLATYLGLKNSRKPQAACLASRIPYGTQVSKNTLAQIEYAESVLLNLGFTQCRVRHHQTIARIEIPIDEFEKALQHRQQIESQLKSCGYQFVTLDLSGFHSGSLNTMANIPEK